MDDPETDEEPGKILHEYRPVADPRFAELGWPVRDGALLYYGSSDSTSWFLVVLDALGDAALVAELEGAWRAAGGWLGRALETGGGFVRYGPRTAPGGLVQHGWRDAVAPVEGHPYGAGIVRPDGARLRRRWPTPTPRRSPTPRCARSSGSIRAADGRNARPRCASGWPPPFGPDVMAIEGDGTPVPGAGSQLGWLLWSGALEGDAADAAANASSRRTS